MSTFNSELLVRHSSHSDDSHEYELDVSWLLFVPELPDLTVDVSLSVFFGSAFEDSGVGVGATASPDSDAPISCVVDTPGCSCNGVEVDAGGGRPLVGQTNHQFRDRSLQVQHL